MNEVRFFWSVLAVGVLIFPGSLLLADKPVPAKEVASISLAGMKFVSIEPGNFVMGSPADEVGRGRDEDQVEATISEPFYLAESEITQSQWLEIMKTTPDEQVNGRDGPIGRGANLASEASALGPNEPMVFVSWEDAVLFCEKLTAAEKELGNLPEGFHFSLPTEAQWEYACRAGTKTVFAFGDTLTSEQANFYGKIPYGVEGEGVYHEKTLPVKSFEPNAWGLYDMHGNVYEWCLDWYSEKAPGGKDPNILTEGDGRNIRGGAWNRKATSSRSSYRYSALPTRRTYNIGFRVALVKD